jgi:acyl-homoserine-lactone acylase
MRYTLLILIITLTGFAACGTAEPAQESAAVTERAIPADNDLSDQVIVRRTDFGVPHIYADNMKAAGYAMGYLQMEDYGERVAEIFLRARGEWAKHNELYGNQRASAIDSDAFNRRDYQLAMETWHELEQDTRDIMEGFAMGMNRYIELHPDEFDDWVKPHYTKYDAHARGIVGHSGATVRRFLAALERERAVRQEEEEELSSLNGEGMYHNDDQTIWARLSEFAEEPHMDAGSNVWALAPDRTESGHAILMRNPHLSWDAGYYEARIKVPGVLNFYGDFRIGGPLGIIGGWNERLGWSTTNNSPDTDEIYSFDADPERPDHFIIDGVSVPITKETVEVEFRHGNALGVETREFLSTPYGPVIHREGGKVYIIRSAGDREFRTAEQFIKMMKAQNLEEWKDAMKMRARTSSNLTYADADGNIYYVWNATMPDRPHEAGGDTTAIHVTQSGQMWQDILPWEALPRLLNPEGGYLRNENDPFHFTNMHEILPPEDFPSYFDEPAFRLRSQHSHEILHNDRVFSLEDVVELKNSERMILADRVKDDLIEAVRASGPEGDVALAIELLEEWDNTVARDSRGGLLFENWWNRYVTTADSIRVSGSPESVGFAATPEKLFAQPWSYDEPATTPYGLADPERAVKDFEWAVEETKKRHGHWNLPWGEVHRAVIGDLDVPISGCTGMVGCFKVIWFIPHRDDETRREVRGGDGWVSAVEFGEVPRAYTILAYGQSNKEDSPHFNDQLVLFANNEMTPVFFTDEDVLNNTIREYRPGAAD